jgi:hypothetical protein
MSIEGDLSEEQIEAETAKILASTKLAEKPGFFFGRLRLLRLEISNVAARTKRASPLGFIISQPKIQPLGSCLHRVKLVR